VNALGAFVWTDLAHTNGHDTTSVRAGVDRVELAEFQRQVEVAGHGFLDRIYTAREVAFCAGRVDRLATRLAAKEATAKVLGTGFRGLDWHEIEVLSAPWGEPCLVLHERARSRADHLGMTSLALSLTHSTSVAEAFVVALCTRSLAEQPLQQEINHD
jgi:holo-[acyl-carrier protein] synthase